MNQPIPVHNFTLDDKSSIPFIIFPLKEDEVGSDAHEPHRHNFYEIFFFTKGAGTHILEESSHSVKSNTIHFISPGQVHELINAGSGYEGYAIMFSREFFFNDSVDNKNLIFNHPLFYNYGASPIIEDIEENDFQYFVNLIEMMQQELIQEKFGAEIIRNYLQILLLRTLAIIPNSTTSSSTVQEFKILVEENFYKFHQVNEYASLLNCSASALTKELVKTTGKSGLQHIQDRILLEAKRLLKHSELSSKQIAYQLGFADPPHFHKFFRKHIGVTPNQYKIG